MSLLERALDHASKGYPVFPCRQDKRPKMGLTDWENVATTDPQQIRDWWAEDENLLPAIPPGRVGAAVIDVDRHDGKDDGFHSLDSAGIKFPDAFWGTSLSGNGIHYWFSADVGSVNGVLPGVDRKARGGYVVVPYEMPSSREFPPLPEELAGGVSASDVERRNFSTAQLNSWLREVGAGEPDDAMWRVVEAFSPEGNQQMSVNIARVVSLASSEKNPSPGAAKALDRMLEIWLSGDHSSGDPEEEFRVNVRSAIEKFGKWPEDTTLEDTFYAMLEPQPAPPVDKLALRDAAVLRWKNRNPNWKDFSKEALPVLSERVALLEVAGSSEAEANYWLEETVRQLEEISRE